ncbi:MAG TPA: protein-disulfide reductase DsbD N-terminal domain-containing protein [Candidatus Dormibacteraeota bacterium]|nr:protein-disulfide reductase DsbD N-terminal domain-containing protein [Candidatus Dormibacteraeota bacterium]
MRISAFADSDSYVRWQKTRLHVDLDVGPGWHVYGQPIPAGYAPLTVEVEPQSGLEVGEPIYPSARTFNVEALAEQFYVYEGHVRVTVPIAVNVPAGRGEVTIRVTVRHQACNDTECMPPSKSLLEIPLQETPAA